MRRPRGWAMGGGLATLLARIHGAALAVALAAGALPAAADEDCMDAAALQAYLKDAYTEGTLATADKDDGGRVRLFASRSGTWTLVELKEDGDACIIASGT